MSLRRLDGQSWYHWREPSILSAQLVLIQRNFPGALLASLAASIVTVFALFSLIEPMTLCWWLASHALVVAMVYAAVSWKLPQTHSSQYQAWAMVLCAASMGLSWASLVGVIIAYEQPVALAYTTVILCAVSFGALAFWAPLFPAYMAYLVSCVGMFAVALLYVDAPTFLPLCALMLTYLCIIFVQAYRAENAICSHIFLQQQRTTFDQRLREKSAQSRAALKLAAAAQEHSQITQAAAEKANTDKSKFLAAASHDLRQPLHAMGLFLETLSRTELNPQQHTILSHAHAASTAASEMLTTLLDFSRLEAGVVTSSPKPFLLQPLLAKLELEFGMQADAKELIYRSRETNLAAVADPHLTDLVLRNFISNAIRYTDVGGVLVSCRYRGGAALVEVWDTGIGIPRNQHTEVFKEFHQLGNPERDRRKGLGLGLAIVERISTTMNAKVTLNSVPGRGSVFRLWLECYQGSIVDDRGKTASSESLRGMRILLIDDEEPVRLGMHRLLESWGCICHTADALSSALHYVALQGMHEQPHVILADYRLREGATGGQAIIALRTYLMLRGHEAPLPAIIITGDTSPDRLREAQLTGATLLHKPLSATALQQALLQLR